MFERLSETHFAILRKMIKNGNLSRLGKISEVGITPMGMEKKLKLNRRTLGFNLIILIHYGLLTDEKIPHGEQKWNYYAVSPIGEFVVKKKDFVDFNVRLPENFQEIAYSLPLIKKHWRELELELLQYPWRELDIAFSWADYNILHGESFVSAELNFPTLSGHEGFTYKKIFQLFFKNEKDYERVEKTAKEKNTFRPPLMANFGHQEKNFTSDNRKTINEISKTLEEFVTYIFYYNSIHELELLPSQIDDINQKNISEDEKLELIAWTANDVLNPLGIHFMPKDYDTMEKRISYEVKNAREFIYNIIKKDKEITKLLFSIDFEINEKIKNKLVLFQKIAIK